MGIAITIPHKLSRLEARRRIETGFANILRQVPGSAGTCSEHWDGDRLTFAVGVMQQTVSGGSGWYGKMGAGHNSISQAVVERQRGKHPTHVFVMEWRHRPLGPVQMMNNTAWQSARKRAGLGDLHVHDLRHTTGMRLREPGVEDITRRDVLWHSSGSITEHYTTAQIREIHDALEKITKPSNTWNCSLQSLKAEAAARRASNKA
jgi:hypothetical protein